MSETLQSALIVIAALAVFTACLLLAPTDEATPPDWDPTAWRTWQQHVRREG